ncbi:hypothetical protein D3C83_159910 [compost metagenome]
MLDAADVAFAEPIAVLGLAECLDEAVGGRIRRVARAREIVLADQHRIDHELRGRVTHLAYYAGPKLRALDLCQPAPST